MADQGKCDFCSEPPRWVYPAGDFIIEAPGPNDYGSEGGWAACDDCHDIIETGDQEKLVYRCVRKLTIGWSAASQRVAAQMVRELHAGFWARRTGPPTELNDS